MAVDEDPTKQYAPPPALYKSSGIEIPVGDPWKNDCLNAKEHAEKLFKIIEPVKQPFVMTLSAKYGMGKTTFLKCWQQDLTNRGIKTVLFNAWETDFSSDAFSAFVSAVNRDLSIGNNAKTKFLSGAKKVGGAFIKNSPQFIAKVVAKQLIGESGVKAIDDLDKTDLENDLVGFSESIAEDMFKSQKATEDAIKTFRDDFERIIHKKCNDRLIVFVDELDRCRPSYAVEVLERIKHVFAVKGVIFILAVDRQQLLNSISGVYGVNLDSEGYFRKFIDWEYELPSPKRYNYINYLSSNVFEFDKQSFFREHNSGDILREHLEFLKFFTCMAYTLDASLRDISRVFTEMNLIFRNVPPTHVNAIAILLLLRKMKPAEFETIVKWEATGGQFTSSPIEPLLQHMFFLDGDIFNQLGTEHCQIIYDLVVLFSRLARNEDNCKVCVSTEFLAQFDLEPHTNSTINGLLPHLSRFCKLSIGFTDADNSPMEHALIQIQKYGWK